MSSSPTSSARHEPLVEFLKGFGCSEVVALDRPLQEPAQLDYLDLLPHRANERAEVDAVAENQGSALLFVVDGRSGSNIHDVQRIQRLLANRSDPAWLGIARPGSLEIFQIAFHPVENLGPLETVQLDEPTAPLFFQSLVQGTFEPSGISAPENDFVYKRIFELLEETMEELVHRTQIQPLEVLSMAGRALFFRFLVDRKIVRENERAEICPDAADLWDTFASAKKAAQTSAWLDETFNGDFLPLIDEGVPDDDRAAREKAYRAYFRTAHRQAPSVFDHLQAILNGWRRGQLELDWGDLDFSHIPVGVLSQVYERFSHLADPALSAQTSVHYTPRTIAKLMVDEAFAPLKDPARAEVLDPACGAGIFLVLAFRRLVRERWLLDGERPRTRATQSILYGQVCGFDVSESALRLAALSLYITAIELNASPRPPKSLRFPRNLRGSVLHDFSSGTSGRAGAFVLGSLGKGVAEEFNGRFDIVIGNPPWTRLREPDTQSLQGRARKKGKSETDKLNDRFTEIGRQVLKARGLDDLAQTYENPDKDPDLAFLWRAAAWARGGGVIALAMHGRLFQRTSGKGFEAWKAILRSVSLTGLLNGADLRKTAVWDGIDVPWCVVFARNSLPKESHRFFYVTPRYEVELNRKGRFRIDYEAARPVCVDDVNARPWILKALSMGTWLDVEVMQSLLESFPQTLLENWKMWDSKAKKTGQGYNESSRLVQKPAPFLDSLLDFEEPRGGGFAIDYDWLRTYREKHGKSSAHMPRTGALYQPPLVIVAQSPGPDPHLPKAYLSDRPLAFSQSYYGYSCEGHPEAETLASLIYLLAHSTLFLWFGLMISRRTGFDRLTFNKEEFDALPFPDVAELAARTKNRIQHYARELEQGQTKPWREIDAFLFKLYGFDEDAVQVVNDTLFSSVHYRGKGKPALERTQRKHRQEFEDELAEMLAAFFNVCGDSVKVVEPEGLRSDQRRDSWLFVAISRAGERVLINGKLMRRAMEEANKRGASRIIVRAPRKAGLLLGVLNQRRWWTRSRARLCAQQIIREHLNAFGLAEAIAK